MKQLSTREKILLSVLVIAAVCALYYYFVFQTQYERITAIQQEIKKQEDEIAAIDKQKAQIPVLNKAIEDTKKLLSEKTQKFYPELLQDRLILQIDGLSKRSALNLPSINFSQVKYEEIKVKPQAEANKKPYPLKDMAEAIAPKSTPTPQTSPNPTGGQTTGQPSGSPVPAPSVTPAPSGTSGTQQAQTAQSTICESVSLTMSFKGSYDQMMNFIKEVEALKKATLLTNFAASSANGEMAGTVNVSFYAVPKLEAQDEEYMSWPYNGSYGKNNPFVR